MSALIVRLAPVRLAVDQSARLGMPETQRDVVARVVSDMRAGFHPFIAPARSGFSSLTAGAAPKAGAA